MRPLVALLLLCLAAGGFAGCATPGALHVYSLEHDRGEQSVHDHTEAQLRVAEVPSFLEPDDRLTGFAYDPFTDHFFLRLAPGNKIRVVDRPARAIKREFTIDTLTAGGDLALRPRDGHLFFLEPAPARLVETTRLGKLLRTVALENVSAARAVALDTTRDRFAVLHADGRRVTWHDRDGRHLDAVALARAVDSSLSFDAERAEFYAPLSASAPSSTRAIAIGVFDLQGRLVRELPVPATFVDVGPRSFVRVF